MKEDETISAFAFKIGKKIEKMINKKTDNLEAENNINQGLILAWYNKTKDEEFAKHFGITKVYHGRI